MLIGVMSDTHLTAADGRLEQILRGHFHNVEMVMHAGDFVHPDVVGFLQTRNCLMVHGNMDPPELKTLLPDKLVYEINGFRIGLIHGWGPPSGLEERIAAELPAVDCIVYGHSHFGRALMKDGVFYFNPGSPTDRRFAPANSVGILEVTDRISGYLLEVA